MSRSDTTPAPNVGTESSSDPDRGGMKRVMRQSQQKTAIGQHADTQGLDAPHSGEQIPVNESCAAPQLLPAGVSARWSPRGPNKLEGPLTRALGKLHARRAADQAA